MHCAVRTIYLQFSLYNEFWTKYLPEHFPLRTGTLYENCKLIVQYAIAGSYRSLFYFYV